MTSRSVAEASEMLAEALKQMDGIIAGTRCNEMPNGVMKTNGVDSPSLSQKTQLPKAVKLLEDLRTTMEGCEDKKRVFRRLPHDTRNFLKQWLFESLEPMTNGYSNENLEDRCRRLEADKESLVLQVSVLKEQVEAQSETIGDMELALDEKKTRLAGTEEMLQQELLSRTTLETHKLDLMAEISNLKLRLATSEKQRLDLLEKCEKSQKRAEGIQTKLEERTMEIAELRTKVGKNGTIPAASETDWQIKTLEREKTLDRLKRKRKEENNEVERLKKAVESLMLANEEKDRCIDDLRRNVKQYKKMEELILTKQGRKGFDDMDDPSDNSSTPTSSPSANDTVKETKQADRFARKDNGHHFHYNTAPARPSHMPHPTATSTPVNSYTESPANNNYSPPSTIQSPKSHLTITRSNSCEDMQHLPHRSSPTAKHHEQGYGTLPNMNINRVDKDPGAEPLPPSSKKNKVRTEVGTDEETTSSDYMAQQYKALTTRTYAEPAPKKKSKGIKRFFGKLRRSNSQDFDNDFPGEFKRNGLRSTAGPRLGWSKDVVNNSDLDAPFARWDGDRVAVWMHSIGLSMYVGSCKRWVKNGAQLISASSNELEKEMNMRVPFHRKKLQLALKSVTSDTRSKLDELDHNWVTRWLDDVGLPQYKDFFLEARIDGRMLHFLTVDDLLTLKVSNELHHISIKRAIQVLRVNQFDPCCLKRRPAPDEVQFNNAPSEVMLWTNHRVMEWLRTIDLSEYAPNLRGSGVHGALMVLEPRFSSETFATILSIPYSKTLLRRHLHTHFVSLLGNDTQAAKRDYETSSNFIPLTPNTKIKATRRMFHKRSKSDTDFVCPMDLEGTVIPFGNANSRSPTLSREEKEKEEKTAKEIGQFSHELNTLTNMLSKAQFDQVPTSNV